MVKKRVGKKSLSEKQMKNSFKVRRGRNPWNAIAIAIILVILFVIGFLIYKNVLFSPILLSPVCEYSTTIDTDSVKAGWDGDGVAAICNAEGVGNDNCPLTFNSDQMDKDKDNVGDVCDYCLKAGADIDKDGFCDSVDDLSIVQDFKQDKKTAVPFISIGGIKSFDGKSKIDVAYAEGFEVRAGAISAWIKPSDITGKRVIFANGEYSLDSLSGLIDKAWVLYLDSGKVVFWYEGNDDGDSIFTSPSAVSLNKWAHVAVTRDGISGKVILYINGAKVYEKIDKRIPSVFAAPYTIGARYNWEGSKLIIQDYFKGDIANVRIYTKTFSAADIVNVKIQSDPSATPTPTPSPSVSPTPTPSVSPTATPTASATPAK